MDYEKFIGCYAKRFFTDNAEGFMWKIKDYKREYTKHGEPLNYYLLENEDGSNWWTDCEDCTVIINVPVEPNIEIQNVQSKDYEGYNPYTKKSV